MSTRTNQKTPKIKIALFCNIRRGARTSSWQGTGATLVALHAATQQPSLLRVSKTKHYFQSLDTIAKMPALLAAQCEMLSPLISRGTAEAREHCHSIFTSLS